jgi:hypothetical protein
MNKTATIQMDQQQLDGLLATLPDFAKISRTDDQIIVTARSNRTGQLVNPIVCTRTADRGWTVTAPFGLIRTK